MQVQFTTFKQPKNFQNINFGTKKVLFTDFDNTYFPFVRSDITPASAENFKSMYLPFSEYKKDEKGDFKLVVTTGRSKNDYLHTQGLIEQNKLDFCKPDALISSNGANVFVFKNNTVSNVFPNNDENARSTLEDILALISEYDSDISIVECGVNGDEKTYQNLSSESKLDKLPNKDKYISYVRDGKYNAEIVVSKNIDFDAVTSLVKQHVQENDLPFSVESYQDAKYTHGFEYKNGVKQEVQANVIFLKYAPGGVQPDKLDLIMNKVSEIKNTNADELIIVAGDGFNDEKMLNPLNYIEGEKDIENPSTLLELSKLPVRSIICGNDSCLDELRGLAQKLSEKGINIIKLAPDNKTDFIKAVEEFDKQKPNKPQIYLNILSQMLSDDNLQKEDLLKLFNSVSELPQNEKEKFIDLYCKQTGFPNSKKTSKLIEENVRNALNKAESETGAEVLLAGYNPTCSVGNGSALPGSDLDTFFICMKNWDNFDEFRKTFMSNINPLLCSMNYARTSDLPDFVVIDDILKSIEKAQTVYEENHLDDNSKKYSETLEEKIDDWTKAGAYNLDVNKFIENSDKTPLLRSGLLMEILRDGTIISDKLNDKTKDALTNSSTYKYSNMQQMRSYKSAPAKTKHRNREQVLQNFDNFSTDEKLNLIFDVIKISVKDLKTQVQDQNKAMFMDSGCGNMEDLMQPLLSNEHRLPEYKE